MFSLYSKGRQRKKIPEALPSHAGAILPECCKVVKIPDKTVLGSNRRRQLKWEQLGMELR
jgi:hypothetical protein